jgi:hypothetical protein
VNEVGNLGENTMKCVIGVKKNTGGLQGLISIFVEHY